MTKRRLNRLEERAKPLLEKLEIDKQKSLEKEQSFQLTNQIMQDFFPEHRWNKLDEKTKLQLEDSEEILRLTIEFLRWVENNDIPGDQMEAWKQHKPKALERVKSWMKI